MVINDHQCHFKNQWPVITKIQLKVWSPLIRSVHVNSCELSFAFASSRFLLLSFPGSVSLEGTEKERTMHHCHPAIVIVAAITATARAAVKGKRVSLCSRRHTVPHHQEARPRSQLSRWPRCMYIPTYSTQRAPGTNRHAYWGNGACLPALVCNTRSMHIALLQNFMNSIKGIGEYRCASSNKRYNEKARKEKESLNFKLESLLLLLAESSYKFLFLHIFTFRNHCSVKNICSKVLRAMSLRMYCTHFYKYVNIFILNKLYTYESCVYNFLFHFEPHFYCLFILVVINKNYFIRDYRNYFIGLQSLFIIYTYLTIITFT